MIYMSFNERDGESHEKNIKESIEYCSIYYQGVCSNDMLKLRNNWSIIS